MENSRPLMHVLFIGNSYLTATGIPRVFAELSASGHHRVNVEIASDKGGGFSSYAASPIVQNAIHRKKWDFVVLQEQSQVPSNPTLRENEMYPAARILVDRIRSVHSTPVFLQTSANRNGWAEGNLPDYETMQAEINTGYTAIGDELGVTIAPLGKAWQAALAGIQDFDPWMDDRHPNATGAYLAACVLYATLFGAPPEGIPYYGNVPENRAKQLQFIARNTVL
jgi:hypothetical protein